MGRGKEAVFNKQWKLTEYRKVIPVNHSRIRKFILFSRDTD